MNFAVEIIMLVLGFAFPGVNFVIDRLRDPRGHSQSYAARLSQLTQKLVDSTREVDRIFEELASVAKERQERVAEMERQLQMLEQVEMERTERIEALRRVDEQTARHILSLIEPSEKRNARRDYMLFAAGIIVSAGLSILLAALGVGGNR